MPPSLDASTRGPCPPTYTKHHPFVLPPLRCCCRRHPGLLPHRPAALFDGADAVPDHGPQDGAAAHDRGRCARAAVLCFCCVGFVPSSLGSCLLCWQATVSTADRPVRDWAAAGLPPPAYATSPPTSAGSHHHLPPRPAYPRLPACLQASPACGWRWAGTTTWAWQAGLSPPCLRTLPSHRRTIKGA